MIDRSIININRKRTNRNMINRERTNKKYDKQEQNK